MYINQIDDLFDNLLNKLFVYLIQNKLLEKYSKDTNFVKFQNDILEKLKENLVNKRIIVVAHQISTGIFDQIINTK